VIVEQRGGRVSRVRLFSFLNKASNNLQLNGFILRDGASRLLRMRSPDSDGQDAVFQTLMVRSASSRVSNHGHGASGNDSSEPENALTLFHTIGLVATAALLAYHRECRLQRFKILDLALGFGHDLGEACDVLVEAGLVFPDL
jgi:hypothetical protein